MQHPFNGTSIAAQQKREAVGPTTAKPAMKVAIWHLLALASLAPDTDLNAQQVDQPGRDLAIEAHATRGTMACELCGEGLDGFGVGLYLGWAVADRAQLGLALRAFSGPFERSGTVCLFPTGCGPSESSGRDGIFVVSPVVRLYPFERVPLFVFSGLGLGLASISDPDVFADFGFSHVGTGVVVGAGYELGFADHGLGISPSITYSWVREAGNGPELLEWGIGVTWPRRFRRSGGSL